MLQWMIKELSWKIHIALLCIFGCFQPLNSPSSGVVVGGCCKYLRGTQTFRVGYGEIEHL